MVQMHLALITHDCGENSLVQMRADDGFINATAMCKVAGKEFSDYKRLATTKAFFEELAGSLGIPGDLLINELRAGPNEHRGTWVHPDVAVNLGQWLSPKFAVMVSRWVREWMAGTAGGPNLPYHLKRYMANRGAVPRDYFSILNEMTLALIAPLEQAGYQLPDNMLPDISEGKMFSTWLRNEKNVDTAAMPSYKHRFADGRVVDARLYPIKLLAEFREHFHDHWMPKRCLAYFQERDKKALPHLTQMLGDLLASSQELQPAPAKVLPRPIRDEDF